MEPAHFSDQSFFDFRHFVFALARTKLDLLASLPPRRISANMASAVKHPLEYQNVLN
jgi:hypothetical protein